MMTLRPPSTVAALAALALAVGTTHGATTIYSHGFGGLATDTLNGVTPDTTTGANTWVASSAFNADGSAAARTSTGNEAAWLAFTPQSGFVYTLTAVMGQDVLAAGSVVLNGSWMAMGFSADDTTSTFFGSPNNTSPWALHRAPGATDENQIVSFGGPGATDSAAHSTFIGTITLSIVLDTTDTQWTATWFEGANQLRTETYTTNPTINYVGFGRSNRSVGPVESFSLTAVPEPSALLLIGSFAGMLLLRRRR